MYSSGSVCGTQRIILDLGHARINFSKSFLMDLPSSSCSDLEDLKLGLAWRKVRVVGAGLELVNGLYESDSELRYERPLWRNAETGAWIQWWPGSGWQMFRIHSWMCDYWTKDEADAVQIDMTAVEWKLGKAPGPIPTVTWEGFSLCYVSLELYQGIWDRNLLHLGLLSKMKTDSIYKFIVVTRSIFSSHAGDLGPEFAANLLFTHSIFSSHNLPLFRGLQWYLQCSGRGIPVPDTFVEFVASAPFCTYH